MSRTIEDVLAVAGNRPVFEALVSILKAGKAIAFVGAGASAPMYPLWGKFIELLADHAVAEGKAEEKDAKRWKATRPPTRSSASTSSCESSASLSTETS